MASNLLFAERNNKLMRFFEHNLLYRFGPSSKQKVSVKVDSSSKNSVANASHHKLSLSYQLQGHIKLFTLVQRAEIS